MKGEKEEEERVMSGPMFPRLHVNDAEKGWPRAPPRNKMALYEQLSIPLQRFNAAAAAASTTTTTSTVEIPLQSSRSAGGPSSSQGNGLEMPGLSPFYPSPPVPAYSAGKTNSRLSDGENMKTTKRDFQNRSTRPLNLRCTNAPPSIAECSSSLRQRDNNANTSSRKRVLDEDDDDFRVPTFVNSENASYLHRNTTGVEKPQHVNSPQIGNGCSAKLGGSCNKQEQANNSSDFKSDKYGRNYNEQNISDVNNAADKEIDKLTEASKISNSSPVQELNSADVTDKRQLNRKISQESRNTENALGETNESHCKTSFSNRSIKVVDNCNQTSEDKENLSDTNDEMSDTSMVDCISDLEISPDDVVGVIGSKQFLKARNAIVKHCFFWRMFILSQQRVFGIQVFELHRLIRVQKLLAASPHLLEENHYAKGSTKNLPLQPYHFKPQPETPREKDDSQKPNERRDNQTESTGTIQPCPLPPYNGSVIKAPAQPPRHSGPYNNSGNPALAPAPLPPTADNRSNPLCLQPPAQQWLVPVMSPSEGLIYKPYPGPCPPAPASFMPPVYGNFHHPMSLLPPYGASHIPPNYFPTPFGLNNRNPMISNPAVEQPVPLMPNGQSEQNNSRSSCNMSFPKSDAITGRPWRCHASKESDLQGSTASSLSERGAQGRDLLSLFPMASPAEGSLRISESSEKEHQARVIKVVPHNARSATESAARIFKSIQEEKTAN